MSYELRIGLLAAICIVVTVWGYKFMKGKNILNASNYYYVKYENVDQLAATSPVLIYGLRVGTVSKIELGDDMQSIIATLDIDKGIKIPKDTRALIVNTSLMGGKAVILEYDEPCKDADCARRGDFLEGGTRGYFDSVVSDEDIERLKQGVGDILSVASDTLSSPDSKSAFAELFRDLQLTLNNMGIITTQLNTSLQKYDRNMDETLRNLNTISTTIAESSSTITSTLQNLDAISSDLVENDLAGQASHVLTSADNAVEEFKMTLQDANASFTELSGILKGIQDGEGTLGLLARDKELYKNLNASLSNLDLLLQDLRLNPKRYIHVSVFGKKQRSYELPEDDPAWEEQ